MAASTTNRSNPPSGNAVDEREHLVAQPNAVDYKALNSSELFQAIAQDNRVLADETTLFNILQQRRNKKDDFLAVLAYLDQNIQLSEQPRAQFLLNQLNLASHYCNSDDFLLLTELGFRIKVMAQQSNNEYNNNRCVVLAEQLERSSSRAYIKGVVMTALFPLIIAGIFYASYSLMIYLGAHFTIPFLSPDNATYISMGVSSIGSLSTKYAINRLRSSSNLNDIFLATHEFFFSKNNTANNTTVEEKALSNDPQLKSDKLFQSIERNASLLANNESLFRLLNSRKNKKLDLLAALSYLETRYPDLNAPGHFLVRRVIEEIRSIVYNGNLGPAELALLTELTYRMTKTDNENNKQRCLVIVRKLDEMKNSSDTKWIVEMIVGMGCMLAGMSLLACLAWYTSPIVVALSAFTLASWGLTYLLNGSEKADAKSESLSLNLIHNNAQRFFEPRPGSSAAERRVRRPNNSVVPSAPPLEPEVVPLVSVSASLSA